MGALFLIGLLCLLAWACESASALGVGQAVLWTPTSASEAKGTRYHTATTTTNELPAYVKQHVSGREGCLVVLLHGAGDEERRPSALTQPAVVTSSKSSSDAVVLSALYLYEPANSSTSAPLPAVSAARALRSQLRGRGEEQEHVLSVAALRTLLESRGEGQGRGQGQGRRSAAGMVEVAVAAEDAEALLAVHALVSAGRAGHVLFVAVVEPEAAAPAAQAAFASAPALTQSSKQRHRLLSQEKEYRPTGTEFSIYHSRDYLYMTPDIFTAIMTVAFIAAVMYCGLSCMNSIQGASSWTDEKSVPPIGKEA